MAALVEQLPRRLFYTMPAMPDPALPDVWSVERSQTWQQEVAARLHYTARASLEVEDDDEIREEHEFQAIPIVPTRRVLARFVRLDALPPMVFDEGDE